MGSGGSTEATGKQPGGGASTDPKRQQGGEKVRTVRSDSPVNNNTPRNAKTKFIIKKDPVSSDVTNDLDVYGSSWNQPENNNQEKTNNDYNSKQHGTLPPRLPTPPRISRKRTPRGSSGNNIDKRKFSGRKLYIEIRMNGMFRKK